MTDQSEDMPAWLLAANQVHSALRTLDPAVQARVLLFVADMLGLTLAVGNAREEPPISSQTRIEPPSVLHSPPASDPEKDEYLEGVSQVAIKWMRRNGIEAKELSAIFSLGIDDIDIIAKTVPGNNKKEKMRSVMLLKAVAAYLSTGAARVTHEQAKETTIHYDAYDATNFATYMRSMVGEIGGNKESGYTLTARGLSGAAEIIKSYGTKPA